MKLSIKAFLAAFTAEYASRIVVYEVLDIQEPAVRIFAYGRPFWHKTSNEAILVLVRSSLARTIRVTVIHRRSLLAVDRRVFHSYRILELRSVIASYRFEDLAESLFPQLALELVKHKHRAHCRFVRAF